MLVCFDLTKVVRKHFAFCRIIEFLQCVIHENLSVNIPIERGVDLPK